MHHQRMCAIETTAVELVGIQTTLNGGIIPAEFADRQSGKATAPQAVHDQQEKCEAEAIVSHAQHMAASSRFSCGL